MGRSRTIKPLLVLAVLAWSGCTGVDDPVAKPPDRSPSSSSGGGGGGKVSTAALTVFDDCDLLLDHLQESAASRVGPGGFGWWGSDGVVMEDSSAGLAPSTTGPASPTAGMERDASSAPVEGEDYSGTNVQEAGVDEPDVIKTDGDTMFVARDGELVAIDADGTAGALDRIAISTDGMAGELLLVGDRILVLSTSWNEKGATTTLTSVDVSEPTDLGITDAVVVEGGYRTARMIDGTARVVLQSDGPQMNWVYPSRSGEDAMASQANKDLIAETTLDDWLPHRLDGSAPERLVECGDVYVPTDFAGAGLMTVITLPLAGTGPLAPQTTTLTASPDTVYASSTSLYIASHAWPAPPAEGTTSPQPSVGTTDLHRFDITGETAVHVASGTIDGTVLNQFSLSEHEGRLRVATTDSQTGIEGDVAPLTTVPEPDSPVTTFPGPGPTATTNTVTVLEQDGDQLEVVGSVGDLGRGETIHSVRFVGDTAYVVTFRQTDPFYVIDLSDPTAPKMVGELKIPGYSGYLHPIDATHVVGVGQEGNAEGQITGVKVSLFDVSDPAHPTETAKWIMDGGSQSVEFDARAFLYWPSTGLAVVPVQLWGAPGFAPSESGSGFVGAVGLTVGDTTIDELGRISHPQPDVIPSDKCGQTDGMGRCPIAPDGQWSPIERSVVIGDQLWTLSSTGMLSSNLTTLEAGTFVTLT